MSTQNASGQQQKNNIDTALQNKLIAGRTFFDGLGKNYPPAATVELRHEVISNVSCNWFSPKKPVADKVIIYLHGGAFNWGSIRSHAPLVSHIAEQTQTTILFVDYALAPEHPYPKGVTDLINVYKHVANEHPKMSIYLIGDSGGGGLIVSGIEQLQKDKVPQPEGVVLMSPWLNLDADSPSYTNNASLDTILTVQAMNEFATAYNPDSLKDASPSSAKFQYFPPVLILVGTNEILLDDSQIFYDHIAKVQKHTSLRIYAGQIHVWPISSIEHDDTKRALHEIRQFVTSTSSIK